MTIFVVMSSDTTTPANLESFFSNARSPSLD